MIFSSSSFPSSSFFLFFSSFGADVEVDEEAGKLECVVAEDNSPLVTTGFKDALPPGKTALNAGDISTCMMLKLSCR